MLALSLLLSAALAAASNGPHRVHHAECSKVSFDVSASGDNAVFATLPDRQNETAVIGWINDRFGDLGAPAAGTQHISGTYKIAGVYCWPTRGPSRGVLELLVHGLSYNKSMWTGLGYGNEYDWQAYAASRGYHTLAIDRLGHGSSEPNSDPFNTVQVPLQIDIYHQLIRAIRKGGRTSPLRRSFCRIVWVGHSFGSQFGSAMAQQYPNDFQAIVLTAYSNQLNTSSPPGAPYASASVLFPKRYRGADLGYFVTSTLQGRTAAFYAGDYDPAVAYGDYLYQDTMSAGEIGTFLDAAPRSIPEYRGGVMVVSGDRDAICCNIQGVTCNSILSGTSVVFPNAADYGFYAPPNTGHDLTLHLTAPSTFREVHNWLDSYFHHR
ncbi:hypothetical protein VTK73DRAFT_4277 [Phialemonium thermophilum]|uniref:AB hydrolase-1 domain-containing protein n=1 Tax=Phialemonium thermophilum TaxID=223376 RepID=A0ABR3WUT5_9PEZI